MADTTIVNPPKKVIYCFSHIQPMIQKLAETNPKVKLHQGLDPVLWQDHDPRIHLLLAIDDLMSEESTFKHLSNLFTKGRHLNLSIIFCTQVSSAANGG